MIAQYPLGGVVFKGMSKKPIPKKLLWPINTEAKSAMNQSEFLSITCDLHNAKENSHIEGVIAFSFAFHWL